MTMSRESLSDSLITQVIEGFSNLILDPDLVPNGTHVNIPQYANKAEEDVITLTWQSASGPSYSISVTVDAGNANGPIPVKIAYKPYIIDNLDTSVSVSYEVRRKNGSTATSAALVFRIERQLGQNLVAPTVREAAGNTLDPIQARNGATVRVAYVGMLPGDVLTVDWRGEGGADSFQSAQQNGSTLGYVDFAIPVAVAAASQGKTIAVRYTVVRGGSPSLLSEPLALTVGELSLGDLPTPIVPQVIDDKLDLVSFEGNAQVKVDPWPLIASGQRYWIIARGTLENGENYQFYLANGLIVDSSHVSNGLSVDMARKELEKLKSSSRLSVEVKVAFAQGNDEAAARPFNPLSFTFLVSHFPKDETFDGVPLGYIGEGQSVETPLLRIEPQTGVVKVEAVTPEIEELTKGRIAGRALRVVFAGQTIISLELKEAVIKVEIAAYGSGEILFLSERGVLHHRQRMSFDNIVTYVHSSVDIKSVQINAITPEFGNFLVDNIKVG